MKFVIVALMNKNVFEILKKHNGTHKKAAESIGLSYTRYNEWRWRPKEIPEYGKKLLQLTVDKIQDLESQQP